MDWLKQSSGWIGFALVIACWIPQTWRALRKGRNPPASKYFLLFTGLGSIALAVHAFALDDLAFMILNSYAALNAGLGFYVALREDSK